MSRRKQKRKWGGKRGKRKEREDERGERGRRRGRERSIRRQQAGVPQRSLWVLLGFIVHGKA